MIDLVGIGTIGLAAAALIQATRVHNKVHTHNGKTIGRMAAESEPHHHRDDEPKE